VIGKADLVQAKLHGLRGVIHRLANSVSAKRGVGMVVGGQCHTDEAMA
jgi:hypothetical protein